LWRLAKRVVFPLRRTSSTESPLRPRAALAMNHRLLLFALCSALASVGCGDDAGGADDSGEPLDSGVDAGDDGSGEGDASGADTGVDIREDIAFEANEVVLPIDYQFVEIDDGVSDVLLFDVPDDAISVMIIIEGEPGKTYGLASWEDGLAEELVYDGWESNPAEPSAPTTCLRCSNPMSMGDGAFAALAPNNDVVEMANGEHRIRLLAYQVVSTAQGARAEPASSVVRLSVYAKLADEPPSIGVVDLNLFFSGAGGWTAENAPSDEQFGEMMDEFERVYGQAGISVGEQRYYNVDDSFDVIEGLSGADGDLGALFAQSEGRPSGAVNVFFVGELLQGGAADQFGVVLGISGGIPGPTMAPGTTRSGVAIAVDTHDLLGVGSELHTTVAHEVGHYLGLYHTSELDFGDRPERHDPITDTAENQPNYLMFFTGDGELISNVQGDVMRSNPVVRTQ
jgi:hypothetical protein